MIACCSPLASAVEDTLSTLHFASRAKTIQNHAKVNLQAGENAASSSLLAQYETQLAQLREQLQQAESARTAEGPAPEILRIESEKAVAAEAALAQCVREYAKERAQKVRLQQQIGALQKRLLKTQIDELQGKVSSIAPTPSVPPGRVACPPHHSMPSSPQHALLTTACPPTNLPW